MLEKKEIQTQIKMMSWILLLLLAVGGMCTRVCTFLGQKSIQDDIYTFAKLVGNTIFPLFLKMT